MTEHREFTADEITAYLMQQFGGNAHSVVTHVNEWLARGDGVAVYENCELGARDAGATKLVSYGSAVANMTTGTPPAQLPDTPEQINWRYQLYATYLGAVLTVPPADVLGVPAERNPRRVQYACALDNYEPAPRKVEYGSLVEYDDASETSGQPRYMRDASDSAIPDQSVFIIDDGKVARPYYGGMRHPHNSTEILYPFPVNPDGRLRPDNGREIDFTAWMLGPRKMYHLKITR